MVTTMDDNRDDDDAMVMVMATVSPIYYPIRKVTIMNTFCVIDFRVKRKDGWTHDSVTVRSCDFPNVEFVSQIILRLYVLSLNVCP